MNSTLGHERDEENIETQDPDPIRIQNEMQLKEALQLQLDLQRRLHEGLSNCSEMQLKEAMQLQLDVQRRLHEQLENYRSLQLSIEEQHKKQLNEQQQKSGRNYSSFITKTKIDPKVV